MRPRPLHRHEHGPAPFAPHADALDEPQEGENDRAPDADGRVARHERDQERRDPHQHQRRDQRRLPANAVAVVPENRRADGSRREADRIDAECLQRTNQRIGVREIQLGEHQPGDRAVQNEIVPLDGRTDRAGDDGPSQLCPVLTFG